MTECCATSSEQLNNTISAAFDMGHDETCIQQHCHQQNLYTNDLQLHEDLPPVPLSVMVTAPCGVLLLLAAPSILYFSRLNTIPPGHSILNVTKTALSLILCILAVFDAARMHQCTTGDLTQLTSLATVYGVRAATMLLAAVIQQMARHSRLQFCRALITYWFLSALATLTLYWSYQNKEGYEWFYSGTSKAHAALVVVQLLLCFMGGEHKAAENHEETTKELDNAECTANILERITFGWFAKFVIKGYRKPIEKGDLYPLMEQDLSSTVAPLFDKHFDIEIQKCLTSTESQVSEGGTDTTIDVKTKKKDAYKPNLVKALLKAQGFKLGIGGLIGVTEDTIALLSPVLLKEFIAFINTPEESAWKGYALAAGLFFVSASQSLLGQHRIHYMDMVGRNVTSAIVAAIYKKALRLSNAARQKTNLGEVVNLMSVDADKFPDNIQSLHMIWAAPIQVSVSLYLLWNLLGPSVLAGVTVLVILIPINTAMAKKTESLHEDAQSQKDDRLKVMNEVLNGIKVLKLYAWERSFHAKVLGLRKKELDTMKTKANINAAAFIFWNCSTSMISLATFTVYVLSSPDHILDAQKVFVSMSLFFILHDAIGTMPHLVEGLSKLRVSVKRLQEFFAHEELDETNVVHITSGNSSLSIENGTFSWNNEDEYPTLSNINVNLRVGSLVAVVGAVGSGKSSLFSAFLGEMKKIKGTVKVKGSIGYVPQQAWIQNATLKDNILFHNEENDNKYNKVVEACALIPDINTLTAGDQTEIGERGINLSGGQKQRVNLARAVYSDKDTYLLDDPLSAVDAHVGKHIFDKVIGPEGLLNVKTRVLVTHGVRFLPYVDQIIVMKDGSISEVGSYTELQKKNGAFAEFLATYAGANSGNPQKEISCETEEKAKVSTSEKLILLSGTNSKDNLFNDETYETEKPKLKNIIIYMQSFGIWISLLLVLFQFLDVVIDTSSDVWLSDWTNDGNSTEGPAVQQPHFRIAVYGLLCIARASMVSSTWIMIAIGSQNASREMHSRLLMNLLRAPMSFFDTTPIGRVLNRFSNDISTIDDYIPESIHEVVDAFLSIVSTIIFMAYGTPAIVLVMVPFTVVCFYIQRIHCSIDRQMSHFSSESNSPIFSQFSETLQGVQTIRAYGQVPCFIRKSQQLVDFYHQCTYNEYASHRWSSVRLEGIGNILVLFTAIFAVTSRHQLPPSIAGLCITYAIHLTGCLNWFLFCLTNIENQMVSVERVDKYSEITPEAPWVIDNKRPAENWPQTGDVTFEKYSTRYRKELDLVLKDVSRHIASGERVGIVGRTGAGKSTLALALFRIIEPAEGKITIDGIDISELGLHDLRSHITIIPQDPVLFSGSLRMNLDPFDAHSNEQLWMALENAHLKSFAEGLSAGLNHEVSEGGENLSVGQRQLVCLARALLNKTKLLVLDEATAAVDLETDELIQNTISTKFSDCTVFTIAHRLNTILDYDKIMVFDKGHIKEFAAPEDLLTDQSSIFHSMTREAGLLDIIKLKSETSVSKLKS